MRFASNLNNNTILRIINNSFKIQKNLLNSKNDKLHSDSAQ